MLPFSFELTPNSTLVAVKFSISKILDGIAVNVGGTGTAGVEVLLVGVCVARLGSICRGIVFVLPQEDRKTAAIKHLKKLFVLYILNLLEIETRKNYCCFPEILFLKRAFLKCNSPRTLAQHVMLIVPACAGSQLLPNTIQARFVSSISFIYSRRIWS